MRKLVNKYVWSMIALLYVMLGVKCVMMWDSGRGAALLGANLPHYLALPLLLTVGIALANWLEAKIVVDPEGVVPLRRVLMLTLALFIYIEAILLFLTFSRENAPFIAKLLLGGFGVFFVILGLLMPKLGRNRIAGVRYSWTIDDPEVWKESNRVGGRYTLAMGMLLLVSGHIPQQREMFFSTVEIWAFIFYIAALTLHSRLIAIRHHPPQN